MEIEIEECLTSLHSRHINGIFAKTPRDANRKILALIPSDAVIGIGDSTTIRQLDIIQALKESGTRVLDPFGLRGTQIDPTDAFEWQEKVVREATISDVFLTGTNAITRDGKLVNVDAVGNRVAGMFWGHSISIVVTGKNKIVRDLDEAFQRIRNVIAPNHVHIRPMKSNGTKFQTPCAVTGKCRDCKAPDRVCNIFTIIEGKPLRTDLNVVIVNKDLGLSWDPSWPQSRIAKIINNHWKYSGFR